MSIGERSEHLGRVVADPDQPDVLMVQLTENSLQLDQLRPAIWSPGGAPEKDHERAAPGPPFMQADGLAVGIREAEVGKQLTLCRPDSLVVDVRHAGEV